MKATLLVGDYLFVSKYSYGYSHYSIPLSPPLFSGRLFGSEPARGDIVVFRLPKDDFTHYIKRVIGLPGDRIQMKGGLLYINDVPVKRERLSDFIGEDPCEFSATGLDQFGNLMQGLNVAYTSSDATVATHRCERQSDGIVHASRHNSNFCNGERRPNKNEHARCESCAVGPLFGCDHAECDDRSGDSDDSRAHGVQIHSVRIRPIQSASCRSLSLGR